MQASETIQKFESHDVSFASKEELISNARIRLENTNKSHLIPLLEKLQNSTLFLHALKHRGFSGEGIDLIFQVLDHQFDRFNSPLTKDDLTLLNLPIVKATQERFQIFQRELAHLLDTYEKDIPITICSIPCGFMRDLFSFQTTRKNLTFIGIDKDPDSLKIAEAKLKLYSSIPSKFLERDALNLENFDPVDIALSNGLNFYLNDEKIKIFNNELARLVKPGGYLIISHIASKDEWNLHHFNNDTLKLEKEILQDITDTKFMPFMRSKKLIIDDLEQAGFKLLRVIDDYGKRFPTFVLKKL